MRQLLLNQSEILYFKHYFQKEMRLGCALFIILTLFVLGFLTPKPLINLGLIFFGGKDSSASDLSLVFIAICLLAYSLPLYLFRFLMKRSSNDLYLSLPIERKRLFYVHYLIGLIYLTAVSFLLLIIFCIFKGLNFIDILQAEFGYMMVYFILNCGFILLGCFLYTFFTYLTVRCHTIVDAMAMGIIYTLLPVVIYICVVTFGEHVINDTLVSVISVLSTESLFEGFLDSMTVMLSIPAQMQHWLLLLSPEWDSGCSIEILCLSGVIWFIFAAGCFNGAQKAFVRLRSEQCGQVSDVFFTYPLLIPLITFILLVGMQRKQIMTIATIVIALGYMLANFLAWRRIHFSIRRCLLFIAMASLSYLLYITCASTNMFGMVKEIPSLDQIEKVDIDIMQNYQDEYYGFSGKSVESYKLIHFLEFQGEIVELAKHQNKDQLDEWYYQISFQYVTKDNQSIYRLYVFPKAEAERVAALLKKWQEQKLIEKVYQ